MTDGALELGLLVALASSAIVLFMAIKNSIDISEKRTEGMTFSEKVEVFHIQEDISRLNKRLDEIEGTENNEPYTLFVTFEDFENNRRIEGIVEHNIKETIMDYEILTAYKKGDAKDKPSVKIRLEDYVSIEVIKKGVE